MENMDIYDRVRAVPPEAQKTIEAGKLKGMTDINPMWRIKKLTEVFGPCGIGWYTEITRQWLEPGANKVAAFCNINLYVKFSGEWSKPIPGTGGASFVNIFKGSPEMSDEAYKMAYTDAISVACKALGFAADVYWDKDRTKYDQTEETKPDKAAAEPDPRKQPITPQMVAALRRVFTNYQVDEEKVLRLYGVKRVEDLPQYKHDHIIKNMDKIREACGHEPNHFDGTTDQGSGNPVQPGGESYGNSQVQSGGRPAI